MAEITTDNVRVKHYRKAGSKAVLLEMKEFWAHASEAWRDAAQLAPYTDWEAFARKRACVCARRAEKTERRGYRYR